VVAVLVGLLGLRLSRGISQPLEDLTEAAEAIARGEREVSLAAINRGDEIGRLARAFGTMATSVQAVRDRLESEADARGGELRGAVDRLRDLHEELHRSERLAALGLLSGSVGHELRNPLSVMSNVVFLIDALPESSPRVKEYAALLREQIRLSDRIISDLLERARSTEPVRVRVEIPAMLDDLITRANVPPGIDVERGFGPPFPAVWIDRDRVGQVVWNLITNAVQAMDGRGRLSVTAQVANGRLRIEVRDTGKGIAEADLDRVFQPMYTTRPDGVGLGLAISREFARAEGGDLTVSSIEGAGTSLVLELPIGAPPEAEIPEAAETSERLTS
jgi:signal transduction histidine kinase